MTFIKRIILLSLTSIFLITVIILLQTSHEKDTSSNNYSVLPSQSDVVSHRLAVIVPFRERFSELLKFLPHLYQFLKRKKIPHTFYIVNQVDSFRFNRGMLLNVGFRESERMETIGVPSSDLKTSLILPISSMIALHDVDLLPIDSTLRYEYFGNEPYHLIPQWIHPIYHFYANYLGGAMLISRSSFSRVNGFSNRFWGWGREDDEFALRLRDANLKVLTEAKSNPLKPKFSNIHSRLHKRDIIPYFIPATHTRDYITGLNSLKYNVTSYLKVSIANVDAWLINVELFCDLLETSYCLSEH